MSSAEQVARAVLDAIVTREPRQPGQGRFANLCHGRRQPPDIQRDLAD
jgi:hypothetical protein